MCVCAFQFCVCVCFPALFQLLQRSTSERRLVADVRFSLIVSGLTRFYLRSVPLLLLVVGFGRFASSMCVCACVCACVRACVRACEPAAFADGWTLRLVAPVLGPECAYTGCLGGIFMVLKNGFPFSGGWVLQMLSAVAWTVNLFQGGGSESHA